MSGAIEVNGLLKSYGAHRVLHGLTFKVERGEKMCIRDSPHPRRCCL